MTLALIVGWCVLGLAGSALSSEFHVRRNRTWPHDIDVGEVIFGCVVALFGPFNFIVGCVFLVGWMIGGIVDTKHVIFRKHGQRREP